MSSFAMSLGATLTVTHSEASLTFDLGHYFHAGE